MPGDNEQIMPSLRSTSEYHRRDLKTLGWEMTLCNLLAAPDSPCRAIPGISASYGELLADYLRQFIPFSKVSHLVEVGGGYGLLMKDLLCCHPFPRVTMIDISSRLLAHQQARLKHYPTPISFREEDFLDTPPELLSGADLVILNENIGDFPTLSDLDRERLRNCSEHDDGMPGTVRAFFEEYRLPLPDSGTFHFNIGALQALEKLCRADVPYIFLSEHSCEATVPAEYRDMIRVSSPGDPECIHLMGHDEFTIRFSYLEQMADRFGYRIKRGPVADFIPFRMTPRVRAILKAPSPWRDEDEIVRYFLADLFKYEYLLLCKDKDVVTARKGDVSCRRCGKCCLADFAAYVKEEDLQRWEREGRKDILSVIDREHAVWAGDHLISAADGRYLHGCPFLVWEGGHTACGIYATRPAVCRNFLPASAEICPQWRPGDPG